jgi:hypothetical protein
MSRNLRRISATIIVFAAAAFATLAAAGSVGTGLRAAAGLGNGDGGAMMGGALAGVGGGGRGASGTGVPTATELMRVADAVNGWLASNGYTGFRVAEVMAFTNNDYVAVRDDNGKPAFELLTDLRTNWLMEEPPSMMWNTRYGMGGDFGSRVSPMMGGWMMGGRWDRWSGKGSGKVTTTASAVAIANRWLATSHPGERVAQNGDGTAMGRYPGYWSFDTTFDGKTHGMLSVNAATGAVWYHGWHGTFLAEEEFIA